MNTATNEIKKEPEDLEYDLKIEIENPVISQKDVCEEDNKPLEPINTSKEPDGLLQYKIVVNETVDIPLAESEQPQPIEEIPTETITTEQKALLQQQMRQHVQLLTQNFLLLYEHPENAELGLKCKENLYKLRDLPANKINSYFIASNLNSALNIVTDWEEKFKENGLEIQETKGHVIKMLHNCKKYRDSGTSFIPTFPPLLMDAVSKSDAFLYPYLLPTIPFRPNKNLKVTEYLKSEVELMALGLEQFIPFAKQNSLHLNSKGDVRLKHVCSYIQRYMLPSKDTCKIYKFINTQKRPSSKMNAIKHFFVHNKAPWTTHFVVELAELGVLPPNKRNIDELPYQWRMHIKPDLSKPNHTQPQINISSSAPQDVNSISMLQYTPYKVGELYFEITVKLP